MFIVITNKTSTVFLSKSELLCIEFNHNALRVNWKLKGEPSAFMLFDSLDDFNDNIISSTSQAV
jgi:hypothetical protein